jgi:membrane protease YdiL (CAAX protease family)
LLARLAAASLLLRKSHRPEANCSNKGPDHLFRICLNDDYVLVVVTSILFGAYHWWTGIGNIVEAALMGALLMLFYRRSAALWPVVLAHYFTDVVDFAL